MSCGLNSLEMCGDRGDRRALVKWIAVIAEPPNTKSVVGYTDGEWSYCVPNTITEIKIKKPGTNDWVIIPLGYRLKLYLSFLFMFSI